MIFDLVFAMKPVLAIDAKVTEHILHREGIGKLKHTDVAYLWIHDEIKSQRLRVRRVRSEENVADLETKPLSDCKTLSLHNMDEKMFRVDGKWWRCSGTSAQQQVTMSRSQSAVTHSNRRIRSSGREHREIALHCLGLQPTAQIDVARYRRRENTRDHPRKQHQRQIFTEHHEVRRWHSKGIARHCHVEQKHGRAQKGSVSP